MAERWLGRQLIGLGVLAAGLVGALFTSPRASTTAAVDPQAVRAGHEPSDISVRGVVWTAVALGVLLAVCLGASVAIMVGTTGRWPDLAPPSAGIVADQAPLSVRTAPLLPDPSAVVRDKRQAEAAALERYAWVDASRGIVQIPIELAMTLVIERGLPRWSDGGATSHAGHAHAPAGEEPTR